jgi:hypothetical protein
VIDLNTSFTTMIESDLLIDRNLMTIFHILVAYQKSGLGRSFGIAIDYGLDCPGIESRWGRHFTPVQIGPGAHPAPCTMCTGSFPGGKARPVCAANHSPPSSAEVLEE